MDNPPSGQLTHILRRLKIKIMLPGADTALGLALTLAIATKTDKVRDNIETITLAEARRNGWTSEDFCDWSRDCDIFIFACHPCQGDIPPIWNFHQHLRNLFATLKDKITYPENLEALLEDGAFSQDKVKINDVLKDEMAPILVIDRPKNGTFSQKTLKEIHHFASNSIGDVHRHGLGCWHIKGSFSTNSRAVKRAKTLCLIPSYCRQIFNKYGQWSIPNVICQRTFANSVELKVVFLSDPLRGIYKEPFLAHNHKRGHGRAFSYHPHTRLFAYAKKIKELYEARCPSSCTYPILRIDVFISNTGKLIVNEIESLEALVQAKGGVVQVAQIDADTASFLQEFWEYRLDHLISIALARYNLEL